MPNLIRAVAPLLPKNPSSSPPTKRIKTEKPVEPQAPSSLNDPYNIWVGQPEDQEVPSTFGAICVQLTQQGLFSGLTWNLGEFDTPQVHTLAKALHRAIHIKMERDFLDTTPNRIREMLCNDISPAEFQSIRQRVYDTVILGKGMSVEEDNEESPVTARAVVSDVEKVRNKTS